MAVGKRWLRDELIIAHEFILQASVWTARSENTNYYRSCQQVRKNTKQPSYEAV